MYLEFEFFFIKSSPHTTYKVQKNSFCFCNKSIMANKRLSINLERFLRRIKSPLTR